MSTDNYNYNIVSSSGNSITLVSESEVLKMEIDFSSDWSSFTGKMTVAGGITSDLSYDFVDDSQSP